MIKRIILVLVFGGWFYLAFIRPNQEDPNLYETNFNEATEAYDYDRALRILQHLLPSKTEAKHHYLYGIAYRNIGEYSEAIYQFDSATMQDSNYLNAYLQKVRLLYEVGEIERAFNELIIIKELDTAKIDYYIDRGILLSRVDSLGKALKILELVLEIEPNNIAAIHNIGAVYIQKGDFEIANDYFDKVLKIDSNNAEALAHIGLIQKENNKDGALVYFNRALISDPWNTTSLFARSIIEADRGEYMLAIRDLEKYIKIERRDDDAYFNLGLYYYNIEEFNKALKHLNKYTLLNPNKGEGYGLRGNIHFMLGNDSGACLDFKKAQSMGMTDYKEMVQKYCN